MTISKQVKLLSGLLVLCLVAVGCGEADSDADGAAGSTGDPISKAAFAEEADEICEKRTAEMLVRIELYVGKNRGAGKGIAALQAQAVDPIFVPNMQAKVREIRELGAPQGEEEQVEAFLAAMEEGIAATKRKDYIAANIGSLGREYGRVAKLEQRLGIGSCAFR